MMIMVRGTPRMMRRARAADNRMTSPVGDLSIRQRRLHIILKMLRPCETVSDCKLI